MTNENNTLRMDTSETIGTRAFMGGVAMQITALGLNSEVYIAMDCISPAFFSNRSLCVSFREDFCLPVQITMICESCQE